MSVLKIAQNTDPSHHWFTAVTCKYMYLYNIVTYTSYQIFKSVLDRTLISILLTAFVILILTRNKRKYNYAVTHADSSKLQSSADLSSRYLTKGLVYYIKIN